MNADIKSLHHLIQNCDNIVVLTGAGISTESGIGDFASSPGLVLEDQTIPVEQVLSHDFFFYHPDLFYKFYNENLLHPNAKPNQAHLYLAKLEKEGKLKGIITQNIDDLHQKAGSKNVICLHGSTATYTCTKCKAHFKLEELDLNKDYHCPKCGGLLKPDVVLYGEGLNSSDLSKAMNLVMQADMFMVIGTALKVYPAAGLIDYYDKNKHQLIEINLKKSSFDNFADLAIYAKAGEVFTQLEKLDQE